MIFLHLQVKKGETPTVLDPVDQTTAFLIPDLWAYEMYRLFKTLKKQRMDKVQNGNILKIT
jgi:hypothetical protein